MNSEGLPEPPFIYAERHTGYRERGKENAGITAGMFSPIYRVLTSTCIENFVHCNFSSIGCRAPFRPQEGRAH